MLKQIGILSLSLALLFSVGCNQNDQQANLDSKIETALDNRNLKDVDADIEENGKVVLTGSVENEQQKNLAEQTARSIANVQQVDNLIKVSLKEADNTVNNDVDKDKKVGETDNTNDTWVAFKTKLALYADNRVEGTDIDVASDQGLVTLNGKVPTAQAKQAAVEIAKNIDGVKNVTDQLQIVPVSQRDKVDEKDETITDNVENALDKDAAVKDLDYTVTTNNGVVTLTGETDTMAQVEKSIEIVRKVKGVKAVNANSVVVKHPGDNNPVKDDKTQKKGSY